jgi:hypothetical protein
MQAVNQAKVGLAVIRNQVWPARHELDSRRWPGGKKPTNPHRHCLVVTVSRLS